MLVAQDSDGKSNLPLRELSLALTPAIGAANDLVNGATRTMRGHPIYR